MRKHKIYCPPRWLPLLIACVAIEREKEKARALAEREAYVIHAHTGDRL